MKKKYKVTSGLVLSVFFFTCALFFTYYSGSENGTRVRIAISDTHPSIDAMSRELENRGVLSGWSAFVFRVSALVTGVQKNFHDGVFFLSREQSVRSMFRTLRERGRSEVTITIQEGSDLRDIAMKLQKGGFISSSDELFAVTGFPATVNTKQHVLDSTNPLFPYIETHGSLEGFLFPDTYRFYADATPTDIVKKMTDNFLERTEKARSTLSPKDFFEVLIIASMLEAEVQSDEDRALVADILLRRLKIGMPLQMDSTVHYATGKTTLFTTSEDRKKQSPWNTYMNRGLPQGPINNPGMSAINAALHPKANQFMYFLTGKDGKVHYGRTLEEHVANKKYL